MDDIGVIHGRFQVLHNDHLFYLLEGKKRCRHLFIGITNPDPSLTTKEAVDAHRSTEAANPLTYFERYTIIRLSLIDYGIPEIDFSIVPLPINIPELYKYYVPIDATFYLTIYDDWGEKKLSMFKSLGLKTEVMWKKPLSQKIISGTDVRNKIYKNEKWDHLVPKVTSEFIHNNEIRNRLIGIFEKQNNII